MATWTVNSEAMLRNAVEESAAGDTILIAAGDYHIRNRVDGRFDIKIDKALNIAGNGGRANFYADGHSTEKGIFNLVLDKNETVSFDKIGFHGVHNSDLNGSGIRQNGGNLVVKNSYFGTSDSGILSITSDASKRGNVTVSHSEFNKIGTDGYSHAMYVLANTLTVNNNNIHDTRYGHHVKSLSANTIVRDNILNDGNGTSSYAVEVSAGGDLLIEGNTIIQGINGDNRAVLGYSAKRFDGAPGDLIIQNNIVKNLNGNANGSTLLNNQTDSEAHIFGNTFTGFGKNKLIVGPYEEGNNTLDGALLGGPGSGGGSGSNGGNGSGGPGSAGNPGTIVGNQIVGTSGDDNLIIALTNRRKPIDSLAGDDTVQGSTQDNTISAGAGDDFVFGDDGDDQIYGGSGADILLGGRENDRLEGGAGNDIVFDTSGVNKLWGGDGNDLLITRGEGTLNGGEGNDIVINAGRLGGKLVGGAGDDILFGGLGNQILKGESGHDIAVYKGRYADYELTGGSGRIQIEHVVGNGADTDGTMEVLTGIEKIQFSNGYYDVVSGSFKAGQPAIGHTDFMGVIAAINSLTDSGIEAAPLATVTVLTEAYVTLFGVAPTLETSAALV